MQDQVALEKYKRLKISMTISITLLVLLVLMCLVYGLVQRQAAMVSEYKCWKLQQEVIKVHKDLNKNIMTAKEKLNITEQNLRECEKSKRK